jgi:hypothetical protein
VSYRYWSDDTSESYYPRYPPKPDIELTKLHTEIAELKASLATAYSVGFGDAREKAAQIAEKHVLDIREMHAQTPFIIAANIRTKLKDPT